MVAYHFTGKSIKGDVLADIATSIISMAHSIGLEVVAVTSDMGPSNQAMWRSLGIKCGRSNIVSCVRNPSSNGNLHVLADVPHLVKNLRSALVSHKVFILDDNVCAKHSLASKQVLLEHVSDLVHFQSDKDLKLAPNLSEATISSVGHFNKMKVGSAMSLFSKSVSAALRYLVEKGGRPISYLTTAWFIDAVDHWFNLMSSRHPVMGLSKKKDDQYMLARSSLEDFIETMSSIQIGSKPVWKPVQTGTILSTTSVLNLCDDLLDSQEFLLTSRLTQDCIENLFSCVRSKNPVPSARECKYALKMITVAQYLKPTKTGNYQEDDREYLGDLLPATIKPPVPQVEMLDLDVLSSCAEISAHEEESLYYLAGYCVHSLDRQKQICKKCQHSVKHLGPNPHPRSSYLRNKNFKDGALFEVSHELFAMFKRWEVIIRSMEGALRSPGIATLMANTCLEVCPITITTPACHKIVLKLLKKFVNARLHILCRKHKKKNTEVPLGSKSMAMRHLVKKVK